MAATSTSVPPRGASARQWQRDQTISAIERAALPVLVRFGYRATTAEHLAEAAGVSVRTLFRYFPSGKDDVILAELRRSVDGLETAVRARPASESLVEALDGARAQWLHRTEIELTDAAQLTAQIARDQPELMARLLGERQLMAERLIEEFAHRLGLDPVDDLRPRLYAHCYVAALVTGYLASLAAPGSDARALVDESIALITPLLTST